MWDENRHYQTHLRAAIASGLPPKAVIFSDPTHKEMDEWDFKLLKAYYFLEDYKSNSFPIWWDESDRVVFDVKKKVSKSKAALDRVEQANSKKKNYKPTPGQYMYAVPRTTDGGPMPTLEEWSEEQKAKNPEPKSR